MSDALQPSSLREAFLALREVLPTAPARAPKQFYALRDLEDAFRALKRPLAVAKEQGGLMNPWALAGLGKDEVRNAGALVGLWMFEFGGTASLQFAAGYLSRALPGIDWPTELGKGYRVAPEVCPLGDSADRVDLVIETSHHLVGIEVKIRAGLGPEQLERYSRSISRRAALLGVKPHIILLAPFGSTLPGITTTSWADLARAARAAGGRKIAERTFVQHLIASFGEHVQAL